MIENRIVFDGEDIICVYHKGFDDVGIINHKECTTLDGKLLEFIERKVDSDVVLNKVSPLISIQGGIVYWGGFESLWRYGISIL